MQSVRFVGVGRPVQIHDIPRPSAEPGHVLLKIGGAGVCHSGLKFMMQAEDGLRGGALDLDRVTTGW